MRCRPRISWENRAGLVPAAGLAAALGAHQGQGTHPVSPDGPVPAPRDPREPQRGCRDTGDLQPLPGTARMPQGSPWPCPGMGLLWQGSCPVLGDTGAQGGRAQLPPHPPWEDECESGAVGTGQDCDVLAVAANLGCDRARAPWHPHPLAGTQTDMELLRGLCPTQSPLLRQTFVL